MELLLLRYISVCMYYELAMASTARIVDNGVGAEPDPKRRRHLDAGGPIEDDEVARLKMIHAVVYERGVDGHQSVFTGFNCYNVSDVKSICAFDANMCRRNAITPMGYFARFGDLPMMRWLYVNGADVRDLDVAVCFPMYTAAKNGRMEVCRWLFNHGAAGDIKRRIPAGSFSGHSKGRGSLWLNQCGDGDTPLCASFHQSSFRNCSRWLILNGALCKDGGTSDLDVDLMKKVLCRFNSSKYEWPALLNWARERHHSRCIFDVFLMGTFSTLRFSAIRLREALSARIGSEKVVDRLLENTPASQYHLLWCDLFPRRVGCPLAAFCGKSGVLELIGDYVGIARGREARIVRQVAWLFPEILGDLYESYRARKSEADSDGSNGSDESDESDASD